MEVLVYSLQISFLSENNTIRNKFHLNFHCKLDIALLFVLKYQFLNCSWIPLLFKYHFCFVNIFTISGGAFNKFSSSSTLASFENGKKWLQYIQFLLIHYKLILENFALNFHSNSCSTCPIHSQNSFEFQPTLMSLETYCKPLTLSRFHRQIL